MHGCLCRGYARAITVSACALLLIACVPAVPADLLATIEAIDQELIALRAPEAASDEYAHFVRQWISLKAHVESDDDVIRWPWEPSGTEEQLRRLQDEGAAAVARMRERRAAERKLAHSQLMLLEERVQFISSQVESIDGRLVLGENPVQADLLLKQARSFYEQHEYRRSMDAAERAGRAVLAQTVVLARELGRYADDKRIAHWQMMAKQTIEWSRDHHTTAIVVSKADRTLTLYKNGRKVQSYPVRLGFNGIREKQYQGDGATPEGGYRVIAKRGRGQTQFYRALVLDYPNADDRRRFHMARTSGKIRTGASIGGQIEIHGVENELMAQTLGCIMLDNRHMIALFEHVRPGTRVTIVGALTGRNSVALALARLGTGQEET